MRHVKFAAIEYNEAGGKYSPQYSDKERRYERLYNKYEILYTG